MMRSKKSLFILLHLIAFLLLGSWLWPFTRPLWDLIDKWAFILLNQSLNYSTLWAKLWALLNCTLERPISVVVMVGTYIVYIFSQKKRRKETFFHLVSFILLAECFLMLSRLITHDLLHLKRYSPSLIFSDVVRLRDYFPLLTIKDSSHSSFPGDHATVFILWACYFWLFSSSKKFKFFSAFIVTFEVLPRLFAGAHWLTDILIGSLFFVLLILAWTVYTPLIERLLAVLISIEKSLTSLKNHAKQLYKSTKKL